jgi:hypothetical protein
MPFETRGRFEDILIHTPLVGIYFVGYLDKFDTGFLARRSFAENKLLSYA